MRDDAYGPLSGRLGLEGGRLASPHADVRAESCVAMRSGRTDLQAKRGHVLGATIVFVHGAHHVAASRHMVWLSLPPETLRAASAPRRIMLRHSGWNSRTAQRFASPILVADMVATPV